MCPRRGADATVSSRVTPSEDVKRNTFTLLCARDSNEVTYDVCGRIRTSDVYSDNDLQYDSESVTRVQVHLQQNVQREETVLRLVFCSIYISTRTP